MEDVMIRWANDDAPVPTSSELFLEILTQSHSSLLTLGANHNCGSDTAPEIEASGLAMVDPQRAVAAAEERRSKAGGRTLLRRV